MSYLYEVEPMKSINFGATGVEEILQNVAFILSTAIMSCPLDREFGWNEAIIDSPINIAKVRIVAECTEAVKKFEPRAQIEYIEVTGDGMTGKLKPKARVTINESV